MSQRITSPGNTRPGQQPMARAKWWLPLLDRTCRSSHLFYFLSLATFFHLHYPSRPCRHLSFWPPPSSISSTILSQTRRNFSTELLNFHCTTIKKITEILPGNRKEYAGFPPHLFHSFHSRLSDVSDVC